jgi:hypothetical protein
MKDEALRLALEALEKIAYVTAMDYEYQRWARESITAIKEALANEALDKMAENARELGLDYEPEQKQNPYYLATHMGEGWQDGFDGKPVRSTFDGYKFGYVEGNTARKALAQPEQDGECKHCTDGCPACDARKLKEKTHDRND